MESTLTETRSRVGAMAISVVTIILIGILKTVPVFAGSGQQGHVIERRVDQQLVMDRRVCNLKTFNVEVVLRSPSGDPLEDDTVLWIVQSGRAKPANAANPGYLAFIPSANNDLCDGVVAYHLSKNCIAIPLFLFDRPNLDLLAVAIYDYGIKKVVNYTILERYYTEKPKIREIKDGFSYIAVSAQPNDGPDGLVENWLNITWDGKKLHKKWERNSPAARY